MNIGDNVIPHSPALWTDPPTFTVEMLHWCGKPCVISEVYYFEKFGNYYKLEGCDWIWDEAWLELLPKFDSEALL